MENAYFINITFLEPWGQRMNEKDVSKHINTYWMEHIKEEAKTKSTLKHFQLDACIKTNPMLYGLLR